jgi:hypothetical protein
MTVFDDLLSLIAGIIGLIALVVVLSFVQVLLQIPAWIISLDIPNPIKMWILENSFAFILIVIGIPALIVTKIKRWW